MNTNFHRPTIILFVVILLVAFVGYHILTHKRG